MTEPTVTGKAAWDALSNGLLLCRKQNSDDGYQLIANRIHKVYIGSDERNVACGTTLGNMFRRHWYVRPRIGDAPVWGPE